MDSFKEIHLLAVLSEYNDCIDDEMHAHECHEINAQNFPHKLIRYNLENHFQKVPVKNGFINYNDVGYGEQNHVQFSLHRCFQCIRLMITIKW